MSHMKHCIRQLASSNVTPPSHVVEHVTLVTCREEAASDALRQSNGLCSSNQTLTCFGSPLRQATPTFVPPTSSGMLQNRQITLGSGHQSRSTRLARQRSSYVRVAPAGAAPTAAAPAGAAAASSSRGMTDSYAAVQQMIAARGLDPDPDLVSQEAHLAFTYLSSQQQHQQGSLPPRVQDAAQLADHALVLTDLMATGSTFRTLQMLKRHPGLLQLQPSEVGMLLTAWPGTVRQLDQQAPAWSGETCTCCSMGCSLRALLIGSGHLVVWSLHQNTVGPCHAEQTWSAVLCWPSPQQGHRK